MFSRFVMHVLAFRFTQSRRERRSLDEPTRVPVVGVGGTSAREFARHRLHRVPYIGVPRAAIAQHRVVHGAPGLGGGGPVAHQIRSTDFFAHQRQLFHARVVRVGA